MRNSKERPSEKEQRLTRQPSAPLSQDQNTGFNQDNSAPDRSTAPEKVRSRGLNEDEQLRSSNHVEDNAQSRRRTPIQEADPSTSSNGERGQVEDTNDRRLEADDNEDDVN